ncbi:DUF1120 domain-containing protein [Pseudomonas sichuanensis]|uniref:DUF1120 domain-containing protein n=1 Tax=Pseudomonas sichuanensis TaxID=2213015 RepID=UPI00142E667A|nr:DUF1120 domain-containing protein [Pseudomonas sichuanensis]
MRSFRCFILALLAAFGLLPTVGQADDCQVTLSQPLVDFGRFNRTTLIKHAQELELGMRSVGLTVTCAQAQDLSLFFRAGQHNGTRFALGEQGSFALRLDQALLDGAPVELGRFSAPGQAAQASGRALDWLPQTWLAPVHAGQAVPGRVFSARLEVKGWGVAAMLGVTDALSLRAAGQVEAAGGRGHLDVTAAIAPVACTPQLGNGGVVDFGLIPARQLAQEAGSRWQRSVSLSVRCDAPTRFALSARDNRSSSVRPFPGLVDPALLFGVGRTRAGQALGAYAVALRNVVADGASVSALQAPFGALQWLSPIGPAYLAPDRRLLGFAPDNARQAGPAAMTQLNASLAVELFLPAASALTLDEEAPIDGAATLEIIYL